MMISRSSRVLWRAFVGAVAVVGAVATVRAEPRASLDAPATAPAGSRVPVKWTGPGVNNDVIGVVPAETATVNF